MDFFEDLGNAIGGDIGKYVKNPLNFNALALNANITSDLFGGLMDKPDYDPALKAQQAAFEEEKKRRAMEANRTDMQASQAARLFFGQSTSNPKSDMTNDFLGL